MLHQIIVTQFGKNHHQYFPTDIWGDKLLITPEAGIAEIHKHNFGIGHYISTVGASPLPYKQY